MKALKGTIAVILAGTMSISTFGFSALANNSGIEGLTGSYYEQLVKEGIVDALSDAVPEIKGEHGVIESVKVLGEDIVIVTLDGNYPEFNISDIKLEAYNSEWYNLKPEVKDRITIKNSFVTENEKGQSVIVYQINEKIVGNRLTNDYIKTEIEDVKAEITKADNYLSWQMDNGGWDKDTELQASRAWDKIEPKNVSSGWKTDAGEMVATIDNKATYTQIYQIALAYSLTGDSKYKDSVQKGLDFIFKLQYASGGLAQCYPRRGNYSDYVTFNDNAMVNVMILLEDMKDKKYPFDGDIINDSYNTKINNCYSAGIDYILKSQIVTKGVKSGWCAQHDPITYEPKGGRAYEHPSISGSESMNIIRFLMHQEQTPEIKDAVESAYKWFNDIAVLDTKYVSKPETADGHFVKEVGSRIWYRFYEVDTNRPIFSDRDGIVRYDIKEVGEERRTGYSWAGIWFDKLAKPIEECGYYPNKIQARVAENTSVSVDGKTLNIGNTVSVNDDNLSVIFGVEQDAKVDKFMEKLLNTKYSRKNK